ncbi:MAG: hypothetical protein KDB22_11480 [Planctomycetales bacterium]|nr:hypothetical protein [Planctomycetales bacterium]
MIDLRSLHGCGIVALTNFVYREKLQVLNPRACIVLVPFRGGIAPECDRSLRALEKMGYVVKRIGGYAAIDQGRCQMATDAYYAGYEETMWIDSDVAFEPADVQRLREQDEAIICGAYPVKGKRALACHVMPGTQSVTFGREGSTIEILYAGAGFLFVKRFVYESMLRRLRLPICNQRFGSPLVPFFAPMQVPTRQGLWYLAEDFAFCHRARQCGFKIMADTRIRLWHMGTQLCSWDTPECSGPRYDTFTLNLTDERSDPESNIHGQASEFGAINLDSKDAVLLQDGNLDSLSREHAHG